MMTVHFVGKCVTFVYSENRTSTQNSPNRSTCTHPVFTSFNYNQGCQISVMKNDDSTKNVIHLSLRLFFGVHFKFLSFPEEGIPETFSQKCERISRLPLKNKENRHFLTTKQKEDPINLFSRKIGKRRTRRLVRTEPPI